MVRSARKDAMTGTVLRRVRALGRPRLSDAVAGLVAGLFSIPEGMAYASIAGFAPVQGIYAGIVPTIVGSLFARTILMVTTLTSAIALTSQSVLAEAGLDPADLRTVATLTIMSGLVMLLLGVLRLGVLLSFVSNAVMVGFSTGIAVQIVVGVLGDATGYDPQGHNKLVKVWDWLVHIGSWRPATVGVAVATIAVWAVVRVFRPLRSTATLIALLGVTVAVAIIGGDVELVGDIAAIPMGVPAPVLPDLSVAPELIGGAVSVALVALAQAAGIGASVPNPDGSRGGTNGDFSAQGLANILGGFTQALPAGGSLSRTGVAVGAGARTRWAGIFAGVWLGVVVLTLGRFAEYIPMAVIGGLIIVIGVELVIGRIPDIALVIRAAPIAAVAMAATFLATTQLPLQQAIVIGAVLSLLLYCAQIARRAHLTALERTPTDTWRETQVPDNLPSNAITVLQYDGVGFFAELPWLQDHWPRTGEAHGAVVIMRLRGTPDIPSTALLKALKGYAESLHRTGNHLLITGATSQFTDLASRSGLADVLGAAAIETEQPEVFGALERSMRRAAELVGGRAAGAGGLRGRVGADEESVHRPVPASTGRRSGRASLRVGQELHGEPVQDVFCEVSCCSAQATGVKALAVPCPRPS